MRHASILVVAALVGAVLLSIGLALDASATPRCQAEVTYGMAGYPDAAGETLPDNMIPIPYEGGIFGWEPFANGRAYDAAVAVGTNKVVRTVDDYMAACPGSRVHLFGHSFGARIIGDAANVIDHKPYSHQVSATLTGDPRHAPNGIEQTFRGVSAFGITMTGARITPSNLAFFHSFCAPSDGICDFPLWVDPIGAWNGFIGYMFGSAHTSYGFPR